MINFKYIDLEWVGSIKRLRYQLDTPGLNIIKGLNGSGKTTIFNALSWVLYGKKIKKDSTIEPWPKYIDDTYKGTKVVVVYTKNGKLRKITHCSEYKKEVFGGKGNNRLIISDKNGVVKDFLRDKKDGWKWIIDDLGYTFELFKSSVLFGQKVKRIMEEDGPQRNKILEEAFEASFISQAKFKIDQKLHVSKPELLSLSHKLEIEQMEYDALKEKIEDKKYQKKTFEKDKKHQLQILNEKSLNLRKAFDEENGRKMISKKQRLEKLKVLGKQLLKYPINDLEALKDKEFKMDLSINALDEKMGIKKQKEKNLRHSLFNTKKVCSECKQPIPKDEIIRQKDFISKEIRDIANEIKELSANKVQLIIEHTQLKSSISKFDSYNQKRIDIQRKISLLEESKFLKQRKKDRLTAISLAVKEIQSDIEALKDKKFSDQDIIALHELLSSHGVKKCKIEENYKQLKKEVEIDEWLIKDPLSNSGLKAFIFDAMLQSTNRELLKYESLSEFRIVMGIKLESKRKDFYIRVFQSGKGDQEIPHADLSGGQKQLCDICIAMAIDDSLEGNKGVNIKLFDEVFESLDDVNVEKVADIFSTKAKGKCIHIITHLKNFNPVNASYTELELVNGITQIA